MESGIKEEYGGEGKERYGRGSVGVVLPGLLGLEIDRLSLSPNLSISPTHTLLSSLLPPSCSGAERYREKGGQKEI